MTQGERILQYMKEHGSITPMEAFNELGITKLSTRIGELVSAGKKIDRELVNSKNRYGERTSYMRYKLLEEDNHGKSKPV